ncbi:hypothetical protein AA313_de0200886 [Arthrobotrys entomopaga]|nr:hypothetical protein AA313_de0200886 [Arthrobotrys entomopaga]
MTRRKLPSQYNHLLAENNPSKDDLVELRRLGQTKLMTNPKTPSSVGNGNGAAATAASAQSTPQMTLFSYVHLRAPLPHDINPEIFGNGTKPEAYFLMRRSKDGFVSSTGMFKASFPWATKSEEETERRFVKNTFDASTEETAGNLWVHPDDALTLASDYRCRVWIEALVDDRPVNSDARNKAVTPPPPYRPTSSGTGSQSPNSIKSGAAPRSSSPTRKIAQPRKPRATKTKDLSTNSAIPSESSLISGAPSSQTDDSSAEAAATTTTTTSVITEATDDSTTITSEENAEVPTKDNSDTVSNTIVKSEITDGDLKADVEVETTTETKGDSVIESTHVKVEIQPSDTSSSPPSPESPEEMIAKAKEMVAEAMKDVSDPVSNKKRKIEEVSSQEIPNIESLEISSPKKSKRARMIGVITEEKFQKRALIGISATVALG